ncbi:MAG: type VI secretion protein IcmF/TssM N-terminal domain-containing protein [Planctomycetota bacterium]|jgi:hypothetical protein
MQKLIKMWKGLPREVKMVLAMAGLGTPIGIWYAARTWLFPGVPTWKIFAYVIGGVIVICVVGWILAKIFGSGKRKRTQRMADELSGEPGGPTSMDVAAAIKENNQKFFTAVKDMKKNIGLSVYDLPWYIVIGDSGCGKTKLINEGGLQFSTGKPEGYQLGTLNYNWWFSEDAIFIDMAGRLCNPRDDADRREWEAFLNTVGKGRKGYPINGAIVCISADHLLADPPEQIEQDANTTLERLRDLQSRLGVTFATYIVITKCDKIVGFMQFFDRAERDIRVLNQMVGWSKPGEFNDLYDPEEFPTDFEEIYRRLYDLRLRRLNDDADEIDLGLAYCFPEEFRELQEPLHTYFRTLFPQIKNPRAIKNLLFRGVYFTSATREGGLILKHLTERLGPEAAEQFQPLDLYPSKRPYFIRDFLMRKMIPEHGLVFRNEQEAVRNRKLGKLLKYGGITMAVVLFSLVGIGAKKFGDQIAEPRKVAVDTQAQSPPETTMALGRTEELATHAYNLSGNWWAKFLTLGIANDEPVRDLYTIHAGLFERRILATALDEIGEALRVTVPEHPRTSKDAEERGREYLDAVKEYVKWHGCRTGTNWREHITHDSFRKLCAVVRPDKFPDTMINRDREKFLEQSDRYFKTITDSEDWESPARYLNYGAMSSTENVTAALDNVRTYMRAYAVLDSRNPDPVIREWMRIREACDMVGNSYYDMLDASEAEFRTSEDMAAFKTTFVTGAKTLEDNLAETQWKSDASLESLRDALLKQRQDTWIAYEAELEAALSTCAPEDDDGVVAMIAALSRGDRSIGLDEVLWQSLREANLTTSNFDPKYYTDREAFMKTVSEMYEPYAALIIFNPDAASNKEKLVLTTHAVAVNDAVQMIAKAMAGADFGRANPPGEISDWLEAFTAFGEAAGPGDAPVELALLPEDWAPVRLAKLYDDHQMLIQRGRLRGLLDTIKFGLESTNDWGLAELYGNAFSPTDSVFYIPAPDITAAAQARPEAKKPEKEKEEEKKSSGPVFGRRSRTRSQTERARQEKRTDIAAAVAQGSGSKPTATSGDFMRNRLEETFDLVSNLRAIEKRFYLTRGPDVDMPLHEECAMLLEDATKRYMTAYVASWSDAYSSKSINELKAIMDESDDWAELLSSLPFVRCYPRGGAYQCDPYNQYSEWIDIKEWMRDSLARGWQHPSVSFITESTRPDLPQFAADSPWTAVSKEYVLRWESLGKRLVQTKSLPVKFLPRPSAPSASNRSIPWGEIERFREEVGMTDETQITGKMSEFEALAQDYLSQAITDSLYRVQQRALDGESSGIGWPYLDGTISNSKMRETLDFENFKRFLLEIRNAEVYFEPLEKDLPPNESLVTRRREFYRNCREWFEFLGMKETKKLEHSDLTITEVMYIDPFHPDMREIANKPQETAQNYYEKATLSLGLIIRDEGENKFKRQPLEIPLWAEKRDQSSWQAKWQWDASGPIAFKLVDGKRIGDATNKLKSVTEPIGTQSPLSLCSYLETGKNVGDRRTWATIESLDLPSALGKVGQKSQADALRRQGKTTYGVGFRFILDRSLPEPIRPISPGR